MPVDLFSLLKYLDEVLEKASIFSALISWDGNVKKGDKTIKVKIIPVENRKDQWFYLIEPYKDFVFIPYPVNPSIYIDYGTQRGDSNPSSNFFRFVGNPLAHFASGGEPNIKVDFMVFGYKPSDLLNNHKKTS